MTAGEIWQVDLELPSCATPNQSDTALCFFNIG